MRGHACLPCTRGSPCSAVFRSCAEVASAILMHPLDPLRYHQLLGAADAGVTKKPLAKYYPTMPETTQMASRLAESLLTTAMQARLAGCCRALLSLSKQCRSWHRFALLYHQRSVCHHAHAALSTLHEPDRARALALAERSIRLLAAWATGRQA